MSERPRWTTPDEIEAKLRRAWDSGRMLAERLHGTGERLFPWELRLRRPDARALGAEFEAVQRWSQNLEHGSKRIRGLGYDLVYEEINHRQLGRNRIPVAALVQTEADALALLDVTERAARFSRLVEATLASFPALHTWLVQHPLVLLQHAEVWSKVLAVLGWMCAHPRPGVYLRQLEVPGVDSKFVEGNKSLLSELLDLVLPPDAISAEAVGARQFELRYGILPKPQLVRFRFLDPSQHLAGLKDISTPAAQFAQLQLDVDLVFITENETNGIAFPDCPRAIVMFGLGYGLLRLSQILWLRTKLISYWGDIDTHGFAMLDRLRAQLPHARSFLMDRETLMAHPTQWVHEASPTSLDLKRLDAEEASLYEDLRRDVLGTGIRLEQERISFAWVRRAVHRHHAISLPGEAP